VFDGLKIFLETARLFVVGQPVLFVMTSGLLIAIVSVVGEIIIYWAARWGGRPLIERLVARGWLRANAHGMQRAEALFSRWGVHLVIFGRILPGIRTLVSVPAGLSRMNFGLFVGAAFGGAVVWNTLLVGIGYSLGFSVIPLDVFGLG
jgi:alkaline phosphatase